MGDNRISMGKTMNKRLAWDAEKAAAAKMQQVNGTEYSIRTCVCHQSISWSGIDDRLDAFMVEHARCVGVEPVLACGRAFLSPAPGAFDPKGDACACNHPAGHTGTCGWA